jgi:DNA-binding protein HU-beta
LAAELAARNGLTKKAGVETLQSPATLARKHARNAFSLPGIGKLVLVPRKARTGRNPKTRETFQKPAGNVIKFPVAKAAKDLIPGARCSMPLRRFLAGAARFSGRLFLLSKRPPSCLVAP